MLGNFCGESLSASAIKAIDRDKILNRRTNIGSIIVLLNTRLSRFNRVFSFPIASSESYTIN